jgi:hypothetical protein
MESKWLGCDFREGCCVDFGNVAWDLDFDILVALTCKTMGKRQTRLLKFYANVVRAMLCNMRIGFSTEMRSTAFDYE